ncbi:MAG: hypothetical protein P8O23_05810 [Opitutales bacterium]|nr:hypothetical protein [Opitutales bacterium]
MMFILLPGKEQALKFKIQGIGKNKKRALKSLPKMDVRFKLEDISFDLEKIMDLSMKE